MTDIAVPTAVRRTVSFSRAIYEGKAVVEGVEAIYCGRINTEATNGEACKNTELPVGEACKNAEISIDEVCKNTEISLDEVCKSTDISAGEVCKKIEECIASGKIAVIVDPEAAVRKYFKPDVIIDAIIAKKNLGTRITDAPLVIGVGPGFTAGVDCHCVIETKRGHYLGKVIYSGSAIPNTGVPGDIGGFTTERIIRATADGVFIPVKQIGDRVDAGDVVANVEHGIGDSEIPVYSNISGIIRGLLQEGVSVSSGMKCGDVDPRCDQEHCYTISDKARAIGGGALEAISRFEHRRNSTGIVLLAAGEGKRYGSNKLLEEINGKRMFENAVDAAFRAISHIKGYASRNYFTASDSITTSYHVIPDHVTTTDQFSIPDQVCVPGLVIVTGYDEIAEYASHRGFTVVRNDRPELGISESLKIGLAGALNVGTTSGFYKNVDKEVNKEAYNYITQKKNPDNIIFSVCDQPGLTDESFSRLINGYAASDKGLACMARQTAEEKTSAAQQTAEGKASAAIIKDQLGNPCIFSKKYFSELMQLTGDTGGKRVIMAHREDLQVVYASESELADIDYPQ
ncbi:MAG: EF2563 family selenium-dependent molybdenum hydroxylase system protein [Lachnospiraceae bacterium]|nr:EF2563 family selenium-dependent molybdenum hydroxylase system protein [Lachnospiraceae bacterium]